MKRLMGPSVLQPGLRAPKTGVQAGFILRVSSWSASVITAVGINVLCVAALAGLRAQSLADGPASIYRQGESQEWLIGLASRLVPSGLWARLEAMFGAGNHVVVLTAVAGTAACALPYLFAIFNTQRQRTPCLDSDQLSGTSLTSSRVTFWRRVFLLLCTLTATELSALACVNWAAGYAAAVLLVPLSMAAYRMLV